MPLGDELKWLLKEGGGCIVKSCDISIENTIESGYQAHIHYLAHTVY